MQARLRKFYKKGEIPKQLISLNRLEIAQDLNRKITKNTIAHYMIENPMKETLPLEFMSKVEGMVVKFLEEHPNSKAQIRLICVMNKIDMALNREIDLQEAGFSSGQEPIYEGTNKVEVFGKMREKILESARAYVNSMAVFK